MSYTKQQLTNYKKLSTEDLAKYVELCDNAVMDLVGGRGKENYRKDIDILEKYLEELEQKYNYDGDKFFIEPNSGYIFPESRNKQITEIVKKNSKFFLEVLN